MKRSPLARQKPLYRQKLRTRTAPKKQRPSPATDESLDLEVLREEPVGAEFTSIDFFAGSGLVTEALRGEFRSLWANDNSRKKAEVFRINHHWVRFDSRSIVNVQGGDVPSADLSWASFPCQDLSLAGNMDGINGARSSMVWQWLRVMNEMGDRRPRVVAIENVTGLVSAKGGQHFRELHKALTALGYKAGAMILDAVHWVPQSRPRVFVVGVPKDLEAGALEGTAGNWLHTESVKNASRGLKDWVWWNLPRPPRRSLQLEELIEWDAAHHDEDETRRNLEMVPENHQRKLLLEMANGFRVAPGYKRTRGRQVLELRFDGVAGCLRTPEGGSSRQYLVLKSKDRLVTRLITIREAARLMGAPEDYRLPRSYNEAYAALGDAVAVPPARYLSQHLLAPLARLAQRL
ncbi:MAG: DNA cytosine methyltransferase [Verrucomicrobia bacterium]|nr:DNA cytosine methyltransferase [Verrucomicrobiota bacterium]